MSEPDKRTKLSTDPHAEAVLIHALQAFADLVHERYPNASDLIEQAALIVENASKPIPHDRYKH